MIKRHFIKDISDIKYCEEHCLKIHTVLKNSYRFIEGGWCYFNCNGILVKYNTSIDCKNSLYYEEATKADIGKLCLFWGRDYKDAELGILEEVSYDDDEVKYLSKQEYWYYHCRPLTKEEIKEFMEKAE